MKFRRWICAADNHGDQADPHTLAAFLEFNKHWKAEHKIHLGDCFDVRWLRGKASEGEKRERVTADIDAGIDFIRQFKPTHFLAGNHDFRLWRAAECDDGKVADFAAYLIVDIKDALGDAQLFPWGKRHGVYNHDGLRFLHGYHAGMYACRQAASIYGLCAFGHVHASDQASAPHVTGAAVAHSSGAICKVDLDYNLGSPNTLRQGNGWLYGVSYGNGRHTVWHADKVGGKFILPSEMREYGAKSN